MPYHLLLDKYEEERLGQQQFGSTQQGIAPFYADKYLKVGVQVADLFDEARLRQQLERSLVAKSVLFEHLYRKPTLTVDEIAPDLLKAGVQIKPFICDTTSLFHDALAQNKRVVLEGQLGALCDPDHGIYPYPTSSSPLAGFASVGAGVPPHTIQRIVAVAKAYSSCVGAGPFVTELLGPEGDELRDQGGDDGEYGATTGRPRRVGWFDAVVTRYGYRVQGATEIALTLLDVLGYLDKIPICVGYEVDGEMMEEFPTPAVLDRAKPVFEYFPGWRCDVSAVRTFAELPPNAQAYVLKIEKLVGVPIKWISVGPTREAMIRKDM